jgi:hypothetical protein
MPIDTHHSPLGTAGDLNVFGIRSYGNIGTFGSKRFRDCKTLARETSSDERRARTEFS